MNLPDYFLIDLPPEARLTPELITEACQTLKLNRKRYLLPRNTASLVRTLCDLGQIWLQHDSPYRQLVRQQGPLKTGFPPATLAKGLDQFFRRFTPENFASLIEQEFGHVERLDTLCASRPEQLNQRCAQAHGPELLAHISAGNLPIAPLMNIVHGLLARSAQFVKCATGNAFLTRLFAHSLYEIEPKLGACLEIAEWPGGNQAIEDALLAETDVLTASGSDEALTAIRARLPEKVRFLGYGHRLSFGYITSHALKGLSASQIVKNAVADIAAWNQLGCLSPHVFYVEKGNGSAGEVFAEHLAGELAQCEIHEPRGPVPSSIAAAIAIRRKVYEMRAACSQETRCWFSPDSTAWSVVYEADPRFAISSLYRFIYVKGVAHLTEALQGADAVRKKISTVGLAAMEAEMKPLANQLANWAVPRICPLGQMQNPHLAWRHDGRPALADLVRWTDFEL